MEVNPYSNLFDIMLAGAGKTIDIKALLALTICFVFVYAAASKNPSSDNHVSDVLWVTISTLFSFMLTSIVLFVMSTPLTATSMQDITTSSLTMFEFTAITSSICFALLALWLFLPEKEVRRGLPESEDDLSTAPLMAIIFGVGISIFVFLGAIWPKELLAEALSVEVLQQGAFYGLAYMLSFSAVWLVVLSTIYAAIGRFIIGNVPSIIGWLLLTILALYQMVFALS